MRFTRNVHFEIQPGKSQEFKQLFDRDVLPVLKKQDGFRGEIAMLNPSDNHAVGISLWNDRQSAESYQKSDYPKVLDSLKPVIQGTPKVETFEVATTTLSV